MCGPKASVKLHWTQAWHLTTMESKISELPLLEYNMRGNMSACELITIRKMYNCPGELQHEITLPVVETLNAQKHKEYSGLLVYGGKDLHL